MISDPTSAAVISQAAEQFLGELSHAFELARTSLSPEEFERLKQAVGTVVGTLEIELLWPLYKLHPRLEPEHLHDWEFGK
jgi:hypothetical protein